jgi:hypothetical protein
MLAGFSGSWWVAGGWALDLHIAAAHRSHQDVDIAVLRRDQLELQRYLTGWSLCKVVGGKQLPWLPGEQLALPVHQIEARKDDDRLEFLLNEVTADRWMFRRDERISLPLHLLGVRSPHGIPYLCPQVVLLYKAKEPRPIDHDDFARALPTLDDAARTWLAQALAICHPGHEWLSKL